MHTYSRDGDLRYRQDPPIMHPVVIVIVLGLVVSMVPIAIGAAGTVWACGRIKRALK